MIDVMIKDVKLEEEAIQDHRPETIEVGIEIEIIEIRRETEEMSENIGKDLLIRQEVNQGAEEDQIRQILDE